MFALCAHYIQHFGAESLQEGLPTRYGCAVIVRGEHTKVGLLAYGVYLRVKPLWIMLPYPLV